MTDQSNALVPHTPKPWFPAAGYDRRSCNYIRAGDGRPGTPAVCQLVATSRTAVEKAANMALICAAPEMYEYVARKAKEGDADAQAILAAIATATNSGGVPNSGVPAGKQLFDGGEGE